MSGITTGSTNERGASRTSGGGRRYFFAVALVAAMVIAACTPSPGPLSLQQVKQNEFGALAAAEASLVRFNLAQPIVEFSVADTPPSIFVNYIVPDAQAAAFASFIDLPPGFSLAKVAILEGDTPSYWLSLNVYRVTGITNGLRAEWSTYVDDGTGVPRFMIVRARADEGSIDPIGPLAYPEPFDHDVSGNVITTDMFKTEPNFFGVPVLTGDPLFNSTIQLPAPGDRQFVEPTLDWVAANDFIYWINGVNDRTFYNSSAHSAPLISVDLDDVTLQDDSEWAPFLDPDPAHVLVYLDAIEFAIAPWWNITFPDGLVDQSTLIGLGDFKKTLYGGFANAQAAQVSNGTADPTVQTTVEDAPPSVYWHWEIPAANLAAFEAAAGLPAGLALAPSKLEAGDGAAAQWLTLHVFRDSGGVDEGLRAEWSTTVDDGDAIRTLTLDASADHPALDPTNVTSVTDPYTPASPLTHAVAGGSVDTAVGTGPNGFTSSFATPGGGSTVVPARAWVGASDLRYWRNGVADRLFYGSAALDAKTSVAPGTVSVTDGGLWTQFASGTDPDRVWVDRQAIDTVASPWSVIPGS